MAGFATRASFAGHPSRSTTARHALTFNPDHLMGAGHCCPTLHFYYFHRPPLFPLFVMAGLDAEGGGASSG